MAIKIPGYPDEWAVDVPVPDMAELLSYPWFYNASVEVVERFGAPFQRALLAQIPWKGTGRYRTVLSEVTIEAPYTRALTTPTSGAFEWHIDGRGDEEPAPPDFSWQDGSEIFWLYEIAPTARTVFNTVPIWIPDDTLSLQELTPLLRTRYASELSPHQMKSGTLVEVRNHIHRPQPPATYEFRFVFRVRETNRSTGPASAGPQAVVRQHDMRTGQWMDILKRHGDEVIMRFPRR